MPASAIGIDVGADAIWAVAIGLEERPQIQASVLSHPVDLELLGRFVDGAAQIAIDAPAEPSDLPHAADLRYAPKFRRARCGEVALRRQGIPVPWVTPARDAEPAPWIATGYGVWAFLRARGATPVETYPHGIFWRLAGSPVLHKQRPFGHLRRVEALRQTALDVPQIEMWSHDALDALAAAWVARLVARDQAERIDCRDDLDWPDHDGSSIWLPFLSRAPGATSDNVL
jgi:Protein of unknown function (DUF429)